MSTAGNFVLRTTPTSPFGRKVRMAIEALGLGGRITTVPADPLDENDTLRQQNPLGKMPCLVLSDGNTIYDSGIIIEYLQDVAGTDRLLPLRGRDRYRALTLSRLADGIMDASILVVYETRFRPDLPHSPRWLSHQRDKIRRGLAAFEASPPDPNKTDVVSIGLSCALGYLDWRTQVDWRPAYPTLVDWLNRFSAHEPAFEHTRAKDT
ncbi:MAG TPA: glutathione S-transferase N-terminal domain-containing protein [Pseudolabrys sp.]|jgi:glutathione S-transferase|nr:glutathione S-transferase N-terminal domain-containing protein [Pseudolabrys sp.]